MLKSQGFILKKKKIIIVIASVWVRYKHLCCRGFFFLSPPPTKLILVALTFSAICMKESKPNYMGAGGDDAVGLFLSNKTKPFNFYWAADYDSIKMA